MAFWLKVITLRLNMVTLCNGPFCSLGAGAEATWGLFTTSFYRYGTSPDLLPWLRSVC